MRRLFISTSALLAGLLAPAILAATPDANGFEAVSNVERDFAALSLSAGFKKSFLAYAAPDGIIFRPTAVPAVETLQRDPDDDGQQSLDWWPVAGAIARSNDLALSIGPWVLDTRIAKGEVHKDYGYYATVWRKQRDGSWKFVIDGAGGRIAGPPSRPKGSSLTLIAPESAVGKIGAGTAMTEVRSAEAALSDASASDARLALRARLSRGAWLLGGGSEPAGTEAATKAEMERRPQRLRLTPQGGGASAAGDLAYTYGAVESLDPGLPLHNGGYIHVWQRQRDGWRIIFQGMKGAR